MKLEEILKKFYVEKRAEVTSLGIIGKAQVKAEQLIRQWAIDKLPKEKEASVYYGFNQAITQAKKALEAQDGKH